MIKLPKIDRTAGWWRKAGVEPMKQLTKKERRKLAVKLDKAWARMARMAKRVKKL